MQTVHRLRWLSPPQGMYVFMHAVKGTPFETPDQGKARLLTHWEQLDYGVQFTSSRKFFTISPIILCVTHTHTHGKCLNPLGDMVAQVSLLN